LALLHFEVGLYEKAEAEYRQTLAIIEKTARLDDPRLAATLANLALLLAKNGRYAEAEPLSRRALTLREKIFGPHHPEVARV
jgi:tetratricopeptide (TPR) repeat protein